MRNIIQKVVAIAAVILGVMSVITGSRAITGSFDPGYQIFSVLISYNILMGVMSVIAGYFIWKKNKWSLALSAIITAAHIVVLLFLITIFSDVIAYQSVNAMIFRSVIWVIFFIAVLTVNKTRLKAV